MKQLYDMAIIGGGPAGSLAAYKLAKAGYTVIVLDAHTKPLRKVCGEYLCPAGVQLLIEEGLTEDILHNFLPINGMDMVSPDGKKVISVFPHNGQNSSYGVAVNRMLFDERLEQLAKSVGAKFIKGFTATDIVKTYSGWQVKSHLSQTINCRLIIGADGRRSFVAKKMNVTCKNKEKRVAIHTHIFSKNTNTRRGEMHLFDDGSYIGIDPTGNHEVNISLVCDGDKVRSFGGMQNAFNHYLKLSTELSSRFNNLPQDVKLNAVSPITHKVARITGPNWALIGDAAGFIDPLTGEGMYNALWMAKTLSEIIVAQNEKFDFSNSLVIYADKKAKKFNQKSLLNKIFQYVIRSPKIIKWIANFLIKDQNRANTFIGIIGNVYTPYEGIKRLLAS